MNNVFYIGSAISSQTYEKIKKLNFDFLKNEKELTEYLNNNKIDEDDKANLLRNTTSVLNKFGSFAVNKNTFFAETELSIETKQTWWSLWKNNIAYLEKIKNKDLYLFTSRDIVNVIRTFATSSYSRKEALYTFIQQYMSWACYQRNLIFANPCDVIDKEELLKIESNAVRASIVGLDEFYSMIEEMLEETSWFNVAPLVLARYGICGKEFKYMIDLRWDDIDYEKRRVRIEYEKDGETQEFYLDVDDRFLEAIDKIRKDDSPIGSDSNKKGGQVDNGFVLKSSVYVENPEARIDVNSAYRRMYLAFKEGKKDRISTNALLKSRRIDWLLERRKERRLKTFDIQECMTRFNPELTSVAYKPLKEEYEALTGDVVLGGRAKAEQLEDPNAEEYVAKIKEELGL